MEQKPVSAEEFVNRRFCRDRDDSDEAIADGGKGEMDAALASRARAGDHSKADLRDADGDPSQPLLEDVELARFRDDRLLSA
jgi:hypothetical protein